MKKEINYRVGIYCRLSQDDGNDESQSIKAQKEIILDYVKKQDWTVVDTYADDGYTGTNFNRPEFNRMIKDIELGRINMVITKDLSRLGRNYIYAGYYTEEYFPEHNVRYIAINDDFDSADEDSCDFMPLKNIINEWYAKDISKKIRFTLEGKAKNGEPRNTVFPIFGYTYNELYERIPDPETADIVRLIYKKYIEYASSSRVARYLQEQKIYIPRFYNAVKYGYNKTKVLSMPEETYTAWTTGMVRDIIVKDAYLGTYKTAQTKGISFKNKKRRKNEDCYIFEHRYEPLVDKETWELANYLMRQTRSGTIAVEDNIFKGLLYCQGCGKALRFERRKNVKKNRIDCRYYCNNKNCTQSNSISKNLLEKVILKEIEFLKNAILAHKNILIKYLNREKLTLGNRTENVKKAIEKAKKNRAKINEKMVFIIEKRTERMLPDSTFYALMNTYSKEKRVFDDELVKLRVIEEENNPKNVQEATDVIQRLAEVQLSALLQYDFLQKIIRKIYVNCQLIAGSKHNRDITLRIEYTVPIEIMKPIMKDEK